jgi:Uma2 family endonuclease
MTPVTLEEYYAYHPDDRKYELLAGWIVGEPHPGFDHAWVAGKVSWLLQSFVRPRGLGWVLVGEGGFLLAQQPPTVRIPDISFVRQERGLKGVGTFKPLPGAPDLAIEVLSPSNRRVDIHAKVADYLAAGCPLVWLVDPETRSVTVHWNLLFPTTLHEDEVLDGGDVLPGFSVRVGELFVQ